MKVKVKKIHSVFAWSWDIREHDENAREYSFLQNYNKDVKLDDEEEIDVCGICRASYNGTCPSCKIPGDSCPLIVGSCNHNFHYHCIVRWLNTSTSKGLCPMCRQNFKLKENLIINNRFIEKFNYLLLQNRQREQLREAFDGEDIDLNVSELATSIQQDEVDVSMD